MHRSLQSPSHWGRVQLRRIAFLRHESGNLFHDLFSFFIIVFVKLAKNNIAHIEEMIKGFKKAVLSALEKSHPDFPGWQISTNRSNCLTISNPYFRTMTR